MARYGVWSPIPAIAGSTRKWAVGRNNRKLTAVVIHRMDGSLEGSDSWLKSQYSGSASTHFGVGLWNGVPQIRQWVDTVNTAWGWGARPTDYPTPLAQKTLTNLWSGSEDLNWQVISVEVEGMSYETWNPSTRLKVIELLKWIYNVHGNLMVMAHTDCSTKPCPGMATFTAALPGYYGRRLGEIFGPTLPNTAVDLTRVGGLPVKFTPRPGWTATIKAGKPRRSGATLKNYNYGNTDSNGTKFVIWGEVDGQSFLGNGDKWLFGPSYVNAWRIVYIPQVDLKDKSWV